MQLITVDTWREEDVKKVSSRGIKQTRDILKAFVKGYKAKNRAK